jgi:hypothetical protein
MADILKNMFGGGQADEKKPVANPDAGTSRWQIAKKGALTLMERLSVVI